MTQPIAQSATVRFLKDVLLSQDPSILTANFRVKSRLMTKEDARCISSYDGINGEACFNVNGRVYGPIKVSIPDYHTISHAFEQAQKEGGLIAARDIKKAIDNTLKLFPSVTE